MKSPGGLPQHPQGPLEYELVFSITGLTNEYHGVGVALRDGVVVEIPCLDEVELLRFEGFPELEAFVTSGGTSTAPESFAGQVDESKLSGELTTSRGIRKVTGVKVVRRSGRGRAR